MPSQEPQYLAPPIYRHLRGYTIDPSLAQQFETAPVSEMVFAVPWEPLQPGPVGEYLEVIDYDAPGKCFYEPVDLEHQYVLAQQGLSPAEGTPQFHQQMVYAVASLTIQHFEYALGRRALWAPGPSSATDDSKGASSFVRRLRIYPHALREPNAYYSPVKKALLFGYFPAAADDPRDHIPGTMVFTCLSQDIIAHEVAHALLDGLNHRLQRPTNPDMLAFHEAFADIVALFQHFTFPEILRHQITHTRGNIRLQENVLGQLAGQFGRATGKRSALRDAIGRFDPATNQWEPRAANATEYEQTFEPHERGAILVAAIFDAFLSIYSTRIADLLRLYTGGSGVLPAGAVHPDLVNRLSDEVSKTANHVLTMCVRALDYCPPVDLTFGEYLRALITADIDLVPDDDHHYRVAFVEAFRHRGLHPRDVRTLSVENLVWRRAQADVLRPSTKLTDILTGLREFAHSQLYTNDRQCLFEESRQMCGDLHDRLDKHFRNAQERAEDRLFLGLDNVADHPFDVRSLRFAWRVGPDGELLRQAILQIIQTVELSIDQEGRDQEPMCFEGGCTLVVDLKVPEIAYCIRKPVLSITRRERQRNYIEQRELTSLRATYFDVQDVAEYDEPFALLHRR